MIEIKFDETQEYNETQLDVIRKHAEKLLGNIANYKECLKEKRWANVPNFEKKYIKFENDGTTYFMYVESQSIDKWTRGITLMGPEYCYDMSEYQDDAYFAYDALHNFYFNCDDFIEDCKNGVIQEIDREEFEIFFKEATEWALENGLSLIK